LVATLTDMNSNRENDTITAVICANMIRCIMVKKEEAINELMKMVIALEEKASKEPLEKKINRSVGVQCCPSTTDKGTQGMVGPMVRMVEKVIPRRDIGTQVIQEEEMDVTTYAEESLEAGPKGIEKEVEEALYQVLKKLEEEKEKPMDTSTW